MEIDWVQAGQIGGVGFGLVFAVLIILAVVMWLVSLMINKSFGSDDEADTKKEE